MKLNHSRILLNIGVLLFLSMIAACNQQGGNQAIAAKGVIAFSSESQTVNVNESFNTTLTLSNSSNLGSIPVNLTSQSESISFAPTTCMLSSLINTCSIHINATSSGIAELKASTAGYHIIPLTIKINPAPYSPGTLAFIPESQTINVNESFATTLTLSNSKNVKALTVNLASQAGNISFAPQICNLSSTANTCKVTVSGISTGTAQIDASASVNGYNINPFIANVIIPIHVYVTNNGDNTISMYSINSNNGQLNALDPNTIATGKSPQNIIFHNGYAYVVNNNDNTISMYHVDPITGQLTSFGAPINTGANPYQIAFNGNYAYVTNNGDNTISIYSVNANTGVLTLISSSTATGYNPSDIIFNNNYAYVTNNGDNDVSIFSVGNNGSLTEISSPITTGNSPLAIIFNGNYAYIANSGGSGANPNSISMYNVDMINGKLIPLNPATISTNANPYTIAFSGNYAYVPNYFGTDQTSNISMYTLNANTGKLSSLGTSYLNVLNPIALVANNNYLYIANNGNNTVSMYSIGNDGQLAALPTATIATGLYPVNITLH